jgi:hypothetical protein
MFNKIVDNMKKIILSLFTVAAFLFAANTASAQCGDTKKTSAKADCNTSTAKSDCKSDVAKIAAVKFNNGSCQASKNLDAKFASFDKKFDSKVVFVQFDMSCEGSKAKSKTAAVEQGLEKVLESNDGSSSIVLYDLKSKKVLAKLDNSLSAADMEKAIKNYL